MTGTAHFVPFQAPERFAELVLGFLADSAVQEVAAG